MSNSQFMLASYQVPVEKQEAFLEELIATERAYREEALISDSPIFRMVSKIDPEFILEIIEWQSSQALAKAQNSNRVMGHWSRLKDMWKNGGFGAADIPETRVSWALMDALSS